MVLVQREHEIAKAPYVEKLTCPRDKSVAPVVERVIR